MSDRAHSSNVLILYRSLILEDQVNIWILMGKWNAEIITWKTKNKMNCFWTQMQNKYSLSLPTSRQYT